MRVTEQELDGLLVLEPQVHQDARGFFLESFNQQAFEKATGITARFVQDNHSRSSGGVLRGLHYQNPVAQGKLVRCVRGSMVGVAVDLRRGSPSFGTHAMVELSEENFRQFWVPEGFAHGFMVTSDRADLFYKTTDYYSPEDSHVLAWDDPDLAIPWPLHGKEPSLSESDSSGSALADAVVFT